MIRIPSTLFWFSLIIIASVALYRTSDRVQELNGKLRSLNASIESEQQSLHVLKAEWAYLSNPARIEVSAKKYLALRPTSPRQFTSINGLDDLLPVRGVPKTQTADAVASATTKIAEAAPASLPSVIVQHKPNAVVAAGDTGHLNNHMNMQRTASAQPFPDSIGRMISQLDQRP